MGVIESILQRIGAVLRECIPGAEEERAIEEVDSWSGSASGYADTNAYCSACLVDVNAAAGRTEKAQSHCMLPVRRPGSSKDADKAVMAAAGGHGITQVKKPSDVPEDAWQAALKKAANRIISDYKAMDKTAPDAVYEIAGKKAPERAVSLHSISEQLLQQVMNMDDQEGYPWLQDVYLDNGLPMAIVTKSGKLYRAPILLDGTTAMLGTLTEVEAQFAPIAGGQLRVIRQADGRYRWFAIAETAVLNRVGEIDSRALFDSFIANVKDQGYPTLRFYHEPGLDFGRADFLAREEYVLLASGLFDDDSPLAQAFIDATEKGRGTWGTSVGFLPTAEPSLYEVAAGVTIPVYTSGVLREISILPETRAASWFTAIGLEVTRMRKETFDELVRLFGDEEKAKQYLDKLASDVDATNRAIGEQGLVTRDGATEAPAAEATPPAEAAQETPVAETPAVEAAPIAATATLEETAPGPRELVLDDALVQALAESLKAKIALPDLAPLQATLADLGTRLAALEGATREAASTVGSRLDALEQTDDDKRKRWQEDRPARQQVIVTHRPRNQAQPEGDKPASYADRAAATLASMPKAG